jgi:hypothetical protein
VRVVCQRGAGGYVLEPFALVPFELLEIKFESRQYALMARKKRGGAKGKARRKARGGAQRKAPETGWIVTAQTLDEKPEYRTYYVKAPTEQETIKKVKERYIGDQVLMIAGKLSSNGFGLLAPRFGDDGVLDAESVNLL